MRSQKVLPLTPSRNRFAAAAIILILLAAGLASLVPAATAQNPLPTKPAVTFEPIPNLRQFLYLRVDNLGGAFSQQPDCQTDTARQLRLAPAPQASGVGGRSQCSYTSSVGQAAPEITFTTPTSLYPNRPVNITGNQSSLVYHHAGLVPTGLTLNIALRTESQAIASGTLEGTGASQYTVGLTLAGPSANTGRVRLTPGQPVQIGLTSVPPAADQLPVGAGPVSWQLDDTNTFIEIRADDAIRAASWITNEKDDLRTLFAPIANNSLRTEDRDRRIVGHFALQSAFGIADATGASGQEPRFTILREGRPIEVAAGGVTTLVGAQNNSASVATEGIRVWSFPAGAVDYRGYQSGAYLMHVEMSHPQLAPINRAVDVPFSIASQSVRLAPFTDPRTPSLAETQAHVVQPGQSTTYILSVNNTGAVNDTFSINLTTANAPPGWGATLGGPDVQARRMYVPAGETRIFTVTVNAPFSTTGQVIHLVNVTSTIDPGARSSDLTLVTNIGMDLTREVGIIFVQRDLTVEPGLTTHFPVYVWNRGTRVANVSLEIQETRIAGWNIGLAFGNADVERIVLSSLQPGSIAEATLKVTGPRSQAFATHAINLNVTHQDVSGVTADRAITFALRTIAGVTVQVLDTIGAKTHIVELSGEANTTFADGAAIPNTDCGQSTDCKNDGIQGIWYRVWVTNSGRVTDTFTLVADSFESNCDDDETPVFPADGTGSEFGFFFRQADGRPDATSRVENLPPGKTAEVYVFVPVTKDAFPCKGDGAAETFKFVVQARGTATGAVGRAPASATAVNTPLNGLPTTAVHLEGVSRESAYSRATPYVDIGNATRRTITGGVDPGQNITYYVRMTNAASWSEYTQNDRRVAPDLRVSLVGVDYDAGWNVSIRPVLPGPANDILRNPYSDQANLSNVNAASGFRREGWFDRELEVVVQAPSVANASAFAGLRHEFSLIAETNNSNDRSTIEIATVINQTADIRIRPEVTRILAHPGQPAAFLLYVENNGSAASDVTLRASMSPDNTPNAGAWQVEPNAQRFPVAAFKNRTVALLVTPPPGSTQGATGELNVTIEYADNPLLPNATKTIQLRLAVEVVAPGTLTLSVGRTDATIGPSGTANYTMTLRNSGTLGVPYRMIATPIPNWSVTISPAEGTLNAGESRTVVLVLIAPSDVTNETRFASVVRVEEANAANNFDTAAFTVNILGGKALPRLSVPNLIKRVDRDGLQQFEVQVQNVGSAAGRIALEVRSADPRWPVGLVDSRGNPITGVQLSPNELVNVNVTVRAPFDVPERSVVAVEITAFSPDATQSARSTLSAEIHDYGVEIRMTPATKDALPGLPTEFTLRVRNTGNDNDTLNLSVNLVDLPEWSVQLSSEEVRLEPGQEVEVRGTIRSPTAPLPTARSYTFPFWVGTRGGQEVNISKNMTVAAVVTVPNYRAYDVDQDGQLEIAVDLDKRASNGFEEFREIFTTGLTTQVVAEGLLDGRMTFFLDVPRDRPYDGVADVWFNPETVYGYTIPYAPDINGDGTPDYLLDVDRDGKIDQAFDSATERFWTVVEVKVYGDDRIQYLVDTNGDARSDRFFDPEGKEGTGLVTRTQRSSDVGADLVGIDVDDDERVDYYYNTGTRETSPAEVANIGSFARDYWYFFVVFAALVLLTVVLLVRRRK